MEGQVEVVAEARTGPGGQVRHVHLVVGVAGRQVRRIGGVEGLAREPDPLNRRVERVGQQRIVLGHDVVGRVALDEPTAAELRLGAR